MNSWHGWSKFQNPELWISTFNPRDTLAEQIEHTNCWHPHPESWDVRHPHGSCDLTGARVEIHNQNCDLASETLDNRNFTSYSSTGLCVFFAPSGHAIPHRCNATADRSDVDKMISAIAHNPCDSPICCDSPNTYVCIPETQGGSYSTCRTTPPTCRQCSWMSRWVSPVPGTLPHQDH